MKNIFEAPFVVEMCKTTANMYRLGSSFGGSRKQSRDTFASHKYACNELRARA